MWPLPSARACLLAALFVVSASLAPAHARTAPGSAPAITPNATALAVYIPPWQLEMRRYLPAARTWQDLGQALSDGVEQVGRQHYPALTLLPDSQAPYGLLLSLSTALTREDKTLVVTISYRVLDPDNTVLLTDKQVQRVSIRGQRVDLAVREGVALTLNNIFHHLSRQLRPDPARFPAVATAAGLDYSLLVDREKPLRLGTAIHLNDHGQLLSSQRLVHRCPYLEVMQQDQRWPVQVVAGSPLLDLTVLQLNGLQGPGLALRTDGPQLGENLTVLQHIHNGQAGDSAYLGRGHVSALDGPPGSIGLFQYNSVPVAENTGGPVLDENGQLIGMLAGSLNAGSLNRRGLLPANTSLATSSSLLVSFLERSGIAYRSAPATVTHSTPPAQQQAQANTYQLLCYQ